MFLSLSLHPSRSLSLSLFLAIMAADVVCRSLSSPSVPVCWPAQRGTVGVVRCVVCGAAAVVRYMLLIWQPAHPHHLMGSPLHVPFDALHVFFPWLKL